MNAAAQQPVPSADLSPEDAARADLYGLLAHLFYAAPSGPLLTALTQADDISAGSPSTRVGDAWRRLQAAAAVCEPEAAAQEYQDLFIGVGSAEAVPFASWHLTGFLMEEPLARLREKLARLGLSRLQSAHESEDHIAALAEVMRLLVRGNDGIPAASFEVQKEFFMRHLQPWYARFTGQLMQAPSANFYRVVGALTAAFLDAETALFETF